MTAVPAVRPRKVRLTTDRNRPAALERAYRYARAHKVPCWVLTRRTRGSHIEYLAHPWPLPPGPWKHIAVVVA